MGPQSTAEFVNLKWSYGPGNARLAIAIVVCIFFVVGVSLFFPGYATNTELLGFLTFAQVVLAAIWDYRQRFFPLLFLVFLFAGTGVPPLGFWDMERWLVLGVGALTGLIICLRDRRHDFGKFHLVAFFCVIAATVSASVSSYPKDSLFKVLSFFLLFLYVASGMRFAVSGAELKFLHRLMLFCEVLTYVTTICYFGFHYEFFGNPNSLGAVMGVLVVPMMLWGVFLAEGTPSHKRRIFALILSILLLATSYARAGILAAALSCLLVCIALRRYRALVMLSGTALLVALAVVFVSPPAADQPSLASAFIYKGHREQGVLASRKSPWQQTMSSVNEHPWFGSGFGTSPVGAHMSEDSSSFRSTASNSREHGNSYLAILDWVGLLGVWPFAALLFMLAMNVASSLARMRRSGSAFSALVPIVGVMIAGLVHAAFEDWLFAIGYYLCVLFWGLAFVLVDVLAVPEGSASDQRWQPRVETPTAA